MSTELGADPSVVHSRVSHHSLRFLRAPLSKVSHVGIERAALNWTCPASELAHARMLDLWLGNRGSQFGREDPYVAAPSALGSKASGPLAARGVTPAQLGVEKVAIGA